MAGSPEEKFLQSSSSYPHLLQTLTKHLKGNEPALREVLGLLSKVAGELRASCGSAATSNGGGGGPREEAWYELTDVMFTLPRGKQTLRFFEGHLSITSKSTNVVVPYAAIRNVAILDNLVTDTKKEKVLLFLALDKAAGVMIGKNVTEAIIIQTSGTDITLPAKGDGGFGDLQGPAAVVLCELLGKMGQPEFHYPDAEVFNSSQDCGQVAANVKASSGLLVPLPKALLFVDKPALFLPLADVRFIDLQRANGMSATFDVLVHLQDGQVLEFSQIDQKEVNNVRDYMAACNLCEPPDEEAEAAAAQRRQGKEKIVGPPPLLADAGVISLGDFEDIDDEDEDDEDFDPDADEAGPPRGAKRSTGRIQRGGAASAQHDADDEELPEEEEEEEDDEEEEEEAEDDDDDDDDDDEDDDDDDEEDVELMDELGIAAGDIQDLMQEDRSLKRRRTDGSSGVAADD